MTSTRRHQHQSPSRPLNAYDALVLQEGPVAYWTLEGGSAGLTDRTGNGHHARAVNDYTVTSFLQDAKATAFNGSNQYIEVSDHDDLSVATTGILTIEAWMRPDTLMFPHGESTGYVHWMGKGSAGQFEYVSRMYSYVTSDSTPRPNRISGYAFNLAGGLGAGSYFQDAVVAGEWIHYVLVINTVNTDATYTTGYTKVYKNGVKRDQDRLSDYNIIPANGTSPFRIGTLDFRSFFQGAVARVAIYNHELSPFTIHDHYRNHVTPVSGTPRLVRNIGTVVSEASSSFVKITVPAGGIAAGQYLVVTMMHDFTNALPEVTDARGNVYSIDRSASDGPSTMRMSIASGPVHGALQAGDAIYISFPNAITNKMVSIDQFSGVSFTNPLDVDNARSGTSTTPNTKLPVTSQADELLVGLVGVAGPLDDDYLEDGTAEWAPLTRIGTSASNATALTLNTAWKSVAATSAYTYAPTLDVNRSWIEAVVAYRAGPAVAIPPPSPSAVFVKNVGTVVNTTSSVGIVLRIPSTGVAAGNTLVVSVLHDYTATTPTVNDSRGNSYAVIDTVSNADNTMRATQFVASINVALQAGDVIALQFSTAMNTKMMAVNEYSGIAFSGIVDQTNHGSNTSTTPGITTPVTTTNSDDLLVGLVAVEGATTETYAENEAAFWTTLLRIGTNTGILGSDRTLNTAYRAVSKTDTYLYRPELGTSQSWLVLNSALRAGNAIVTPPTQPTTAFVKHIGANTTITSVSRLSIDIPAGGVIAGNTLVVTVIHDYTNAAPTMADARGNTYTCDQSSPDSGNTMRASLFSVPVNGALFEGDRITVFFPVAVTNAVIVANEFSGIASANNLDQKNSISGNSTLPGVSTTITTTNADDLLVGFASVHGPVSDVYTSAEIDLWNDLPRIGTSVLTANTAYRTVANTNTYRFRPTLGTARNWIDVLASYKAGAFTVTPPIVGTASFVKNVGAASTKTSGTTLDVSVGATGAAAGNTLIIRVAADYTAGGGTITDSRGNTYVRDRTSANTGNTMRASIFRSVLTTTLQPGDVITLTTTSIAARTMVVDEFASVLSPVVIDQQNGATNTNTTPNVAITTTNANDLVVAMCATAAPQSDGFDNDPLWLPLDRLGTTGGVAAANRTIGGAYRSVASTAQYRYQPLLDVSASWIQFVIAYRGA